MSSTSPLPFVEWLPIPQARDKDPDTSKQAATAMVLRAGTQATRLAIAYRDGGPMTDDEAGHAAGLSHTGYWKRCSDLRRGNIIEPTGETRPGRSGELQRVCRLTAFGVSVTANL